MRGQKAVKQTLKNRARKNGTDTCTEAKRNGQFSSVKRGMKLKNVKVSRKFLTDFKKLSKMRPVVSKDHLYFYHKGINPTWASKMVCDVKISNHIFCKERT